MAKKIPYLCHMKLNLSRWISGRLRLRRSGAGVSAAVVTAVAGVALAVAVMDLSLVVVSGFKKAITAKLEGFEAQVSVREPLSKDDRALEVTPLLDSLVRSALPDGAEVRMTVRQPGMIKTDDAFESVIFVGQSPDASFAFERGAVVEGEWPDYSADSCRDMIVMSRSLAMRLGLGLGDRTTTAFIGKDGNVKLRRNRIAAIYNTDFGEYDRMTAFASLAAMQSVAGVDSAVCGSLDIRGLASDDIDAVAADVQRTLIHATARGVLADHYPVDDVHRTGALYYNWLSLLDTNVAVIFGLMLAVAGFTLISSLFIIVLERLQMIGILRAIGAPRRLIRGIFVGLGMRLTLAGAVLGNVVALGVAWLQQSTGFIHLDPSMYYLASVPVSIDAVPLLLLNAGVLAAAWLILAIPARVAASSDPCRTIAAD